MLSVNKRLGKREPFDIGKVRDTLAAASDELGQPLNSSDIRVICEALENRFSGLEAVSSKEILETLLQVLAKEGFTSLATSYRRHSSWDVL